MKKVCVVLATGFEEIEALTVVDLLRRAQIYVNLVSLDEEQCVNGAHDIKVFTDDCFASVDLSEYDGLILPGGGLGTENLKASKAIEAASRYMYDNGKLVAAICAAPSVLGKYGLLENKKACCYPGFEDELNTAFVSFEGVECADNVITARSMGYSIDFSLALINYLAGEEIKNSVAEAIIYKR